MSADSTQTPTPSIYRQAFEQVKDEILALPEQESQHVSIDIAASVITAQGVYPELIALREHFVRHLPTFDIAKVDKLETYALAMFCTHVDFKAATDPPASIAELVNDAIITRNVLLADVNALIARGLLPSNVLDGLQGSNGYKNVMMDLGTLASVLRKHADRVAERTSVKPQEVSAAEDLANKLGKAVGRREQSPMVIAAATKNRQAAFTLFTRTYDDVRAAVQFLRRAEGDADSIMPSLYTARGVRKRSAADTPEETAPATQVSPSAATKPAATDTEDNSESGPYMH